MPISARDQTGDGHESGIGSAIINAPIDTPLSVFRRYYVLFVLLLAGTTNYLDRQVLSILIEPIRHDLSLSDTQLGLLSGIAFAIVYVGLAIPAARLADRWSRRKVIALAISVWSLMTVFCGLAQNFVQLFLARVGVGIGEGGGSAPSHAVVGDLFRREERFTAMSVLFMYVPLGTALGLLWGGWAVGKMGWRGAFILAGLPGIILGPLVLFTVPETNKGVSDGIQSSPQPPLGEVIRLLWSIRSLRNMTLASSFQTFLTLGVTAWIPPFLARSHGMSPSTIGSSLAVVLGVGYTVGTLCGGRLTHLLGRSDLRWHFWTPAAAILIAGGFTAAFFLASSSHIFMLLAVQQVFASLFVGSMIAITQNLVPVAIRATASACLLFVIYSIAIGIGPQAIGIASDLLRSAFGEESLRIALLGASSLVIPASLFFYRASLTYRSDLAAADARNRAVSHEAV